MLGIRIKSLRKENDWNQTELAQRIGVVRSTITAYENEVIVPPYEKIQALAEIFGVTVKYLTGESNSRFDELSDVFDLHEQLTKGIDLLNDETYALSFDGKMMDNESKKLVSEQLKQIIRLLNYMNKGEQ